MPARFLSLVLFLLLVVGGGGLIGAYNVPGDWYRALNKPAFNPPDAVFAPVWTLLYAIIAIAGWRIRHAADAGRAMAVWWLQLGLNLLWSPVFFTLRSPAAALVVILALLAAIGAFVAFAWHRDRVAAGLFVPYALWVAFASVLNASIVMLN